MSEEIQENGDKYQNKNNLEKIIKLDKKNGNFDIYDKYSKRKLKIRTSQKNQYINGTYQNEFTLCYFWRHINSVYFKKIDEPEQERLEYLKSINDEELVTDFPIKYSDYKFYSAMRILNKQQLKSENKLNYQNLLKHLRLTAMIYNAHDQKYDKIYIQKQKCMNKSKNNSSLIQENAQLDKLIAKLQEYQDKSQITDPKSNQKDDINHQLEEYNKELIQLNKQNKKDMSQLLNKVKNDQPINIFAPQQKQQQQQTKQLGRKPKKTIPYSNDALLEYLRKSLQQLDYRQTAESISKIVQTIHTQNGYNYVIQFESALNPQYVTIDEDMTMELDRLRDASLFRFYNISQKTKYSHIAQNFLGIKQVQQNRLKPNPLANKNLQKDLKSSMSNGYENDQLLSKFEACHHCKQLFREEYLIHCNYKSGTMGLPIISQAITESYQFTQSLNLNFNIVDEDGIKSRRQVPNRKKTAYSIYAKKNGELVCNRKFCRMCLKQNYDVNFQEITNKNDWVCPFCQGTCFCSRCHRNDIMIKLKDLYTVCGGDLDHLTKDSIFEKYIRPLTDEQIYRRKPNQLQRTGFSFIKQQLSNFKDLQNIRLDFENLRLLCSQVLRREKLKWKCVEQDIVIWNKQVQELKKQTIKKTIQKKQKIMKKQKKITQTISEQFEVSIDNSSSSSSSESSSQSLFSLYEDSLSHSSQEVIEIQAPQFKKKFKQIEKYEKRPYSHILNNYKSFPSKNIKREVAQLLQCQDSDTYSLVVKKIKEDNKINNKKL